MSIESVSKLTLCPFDITMAKACPALESDYRLITEPADYSIVVEGSREQDESSRRILTLMEEAINWRKQHPCNDCYQSS